MVETDRTMDGDVESSLDVTCDDMDLDFEERPVNRYGSPIALPESTDYEEAGPSQDLPSRVVNQTFIESLNNSQRDRVLLDVLCNGRGSLDYAKQLVADSEDPNSDWTENTNSPNWCICNVCMDMGNEVENKCCRNRSCVTSYELFRNIVLDREVLTIAIRARCDMRAENADYDMNSFRKAAYCQFILWKYGKLGKGNRRVCPSCVVRLVRQSYPALDGQYMGFRSH